MAAALTISLSLGILSGCGGVQRRSVSLGTYGLQLCEGIGPFERDAQRLGRMLGSSGLDVKRGASARAMIKALTAVIADARHAVATVDTVGAPNIEGGRAFAAAMVTTFDQIARSDARWRSELRTEDGAARRSAHPVIRPSRASVEALMLVGHQIERLPANRELHDAMARSEVCRSVFGSVRVGQEPRGQTVPAGAIAALTQVRFTRGGTRDLQWWQ